MKNQIFCEERDSPEGACWVAKRRSFQSINNGMNLTVYLIDRLTGRAHKFIRPDLLAINELSQPRGVIRNIFFKLHGLHPDLQRQRKVQLIATRNRLGALLPDSWRSKLTASEAYAELPCNPFPDHSFTCDDAVQIGARRCRIPPE